MEKNGGRLAGFVLPVDHRGSSPCHHGPDPASGVEQRQFEAGAALGVEVGDVGLLRKGQRGRGLLTANQSWDSRRHSGVILESRSFGVLCKHAGAGRADVHRCLAL